MGIRQWKAQHLGAYSPQPAGGGESAEFQQFLDRISAPDTAHKDAYRTLIDGLVSDGLWTGLDALWMLAAADAGTAIINLKSSSFTLTNHSATFTTDTGFTGVDSSSANYLDTGFNPSTAGGSFTQNSAHVSFWSNTNAVSGSGGGTAVGVSASGFTSAIQLLPRYNDGNAYWRINGTITNEPSNSSASSAGHFLGNRSGSGATQGYRNASSVATGTDTSAALINGNVYLLALNQLGVGITGGSEVQMLMASIGNSLSSGNVTTFYGRIHTYLQTIAGIA